MLIGNKRLILFFTLAFAVILCIAASEASIGNVNAVYTVEQSIQSSDNLNCHERPISASPARPLSPPVQRPISASPARPLSPSVQRPISASPARTISDSPTLPLSCPIGIVVGSVLIRRIIHKKFDRILNYRDFKE